MAANMVIARRMWNENTCIVSFDDSHEYVDGNRVDYTDLISLYCERWYHQYRVSVVDYINHARYLRELQMFTFPWMKCTHVIYLHHCNQFVRLEISDIAAGLSVELTKITGASLVHIARTFSELASFEEQMYEFTNPLMAAELSAEIFHECIEYIYLFMLPRITEITLGDDGIPPNESDSFPTLPGESALEWPDYWNYVRPRVISPDGFFATSEIRPLTKWLSRYLPRKCDYIPDHNPFASNELVCRSIEADMSIGYHHISAVDIPAYCVIKAGSDGNRLPMEVNRSTYEVDSLTASIQSMGISSEDVLMDDIRGSSIDACGDTHNNGIGENVSMMSSNLSSMYI